jgi:hypothetical protein
MASLATEAGTESGHAFRVVWLFGALAMTGCVVPPPAGTPVPPAVAVLTNDRRATQYGQSATEILAAPAMREKAQVLFGAGWSAAGVQAGGLSAAAPEFFSRSAAPRVLRVGATDYIAVPGCMAPACATRRGVLLIRGDGEELPARLDDGGFTLCYGFGPDMATLTPAHRLAVDAARRALERSAGWPAS